MKGIFIYSSLARGRKIKRILDRYTYTKSFIDNTTNITFITILKRKSNLLVATKY